MAYKTQQGRRVKMPRSATNGIQYLVKLAGTRATFECRAFGHRITHDYGKGPIPRRMPAAALARQAHYWGLPKPDGTRVGHVYGWCQRCQDIFDGVTEKK